MQGIMIQVSGRWAQFRKPETNNTPLSHDFITKTATIGLIGAVLGIERKEMRELYPQLCEDIIYGVRVCGTIRKQSWAFTLRKAHKPNDPKEKAPRYMEFIRDPDYIVALVLRNSRSSSFFERFAQAIQGGEAYYTPILGLHNCPAELKWLQEGAFEEADGNYISKAFCLRSHTFVGEIARSQRIGFEHLPTYQDANWWNPPDRYVEVIYPSADNELSMSGSHYVFSTGESWCLI
jgi:CRISPR-associated protein Cas5 subtype I-B